MLRKFGTKSKNTSVHGTGKFLSGRVLKLSRRIQELATLDLLDKSILLDKSVVAQTVGGVSDRITVGIAEINSIFVDY